MQEWKSTTLEAVKSVESLSSVEIVIALRKSSRHFVLGDVVFGAVSALGLTLYLLYSSTAFGLHFFAWLPLLIGGISGALSSRTRLLRRLLTSEKQRRAHVQEAAQSAFFELHVGNTRDRTGVLFFFSGLEGEFHLVCDIGVDQVSLERSEAWTDKMREIETKWRKKGKPSELCQLIASLGPMFAAVLPKRHDDVDELANEVAL